MLAASCFEKDGVEIRKGVLPRKVIESIKSDIDLGSPKLQKYGIRNLENRFESIADLVSDDGLLSLAGQLLGGDPSLVRALFFDKTPAKNWLVSWHQDKTVALNATADLAGWGPWSVKDGVHHAQVPESVLNRMITIRLHLDSADEDNACLEVIPGSHKHGVLEQREIAEVVSNAAALPCVVDAGDAVIMRPHVVHRSRKSRQPSHRRVVHLEFSDFELPRGRAWA
ncbi:MAG: phytanoyl-CoA dioxygenase family protein [Pseudomonadota bacterium]